MMLRHIIHFFIVLPVTEEYWDEVEEQDNQENGGA